MRIAVLNRQFKATGGGAERYSIALVEQLAARHEIHVFAQQIEHEWQGVTYHRIAAPLTRPRWINQIWFALATWRATRRGFDVVHSHENTWHGQVQTVHVMPVRFSLFQGRTGVRLALRWLKVITSPRLLTYLGMEHLRYRVQDHRCVVVTSESLKVTMLDSFPQSSGMLSVVTPGVASVPGAASEMERLGARDALGLPRSGRCLLFVGNDYRKKGLDTLLQSVASLPPEIYVAVVGNAAHIAAYRDTVRTLGLQDRVFFLGALDDVGPAYQAADALVHPTREDTFAMVVLEAMAHGLPVVVSSARFCGISGLLRDGENALILVDPHDVPALTQTLERLFAEPELNARLRINGLAFAKRHLWSQVAQSQERLYASCCAGVTEDVPRR
jgi:UDP-glucose:(heptosyl)LPS alpha-1,3-glucosyltransferase